MELKAKRWSVCKPDWKKAVIDCESKHDECGARCCKNDVYLTLEEVESGNYDYNIEKPYMLNKKSDGFCIHLKELKCELWPEQPKHCAGYVCGYYEKGKTKW